MKKYITPVRVFVAFSIIFIVVFICALGVFDRDYSLTELKENFHAKHVEIYEVKSYFNSITPQNKHVEIEFDGNRTLQRLVIWQLDSVSNFKEEPLFSKLSLIHIEMCIRDRICSIPGASPSAITQAFLLYIELVCI